MNKQSLQNKKVTHQELSPRAIGALVTSLVIISIFPIFITFAPEEWPLQSSVIILDVGYLIVLAGYLLVLTGRNRSRWLVTTMSIISVVGVLAMGWLILVLGSFRMNS